MTRCSAFVLHIPSTQDLQEQQIFLQPFQAQVEEEGFALQR